MASHSLQLLYTTIIVYHSCEWSHGPEDVRVGWCSNGEPGPLLRKEVCGHPCGHYYHPLNSVLLPKPNSCPNPRSAPSQPRMSLRHFASRAGAVRLWRCSLWEVDCRVRKLQLSVTYTMCSSDSMYRETISLPLLQVSSSHRQESQSCWRQEGLHEPSLQHCHSHCSGEMQPISSHSPHPSLQTPSIQLPAPAVTPPHTSSQYSPLSPPQASPPPPPQPSPPPSSPMQPSQPTCHSASSLCSLLLQPPASQCTQCSIPY